MIYEDDLSDIILDIDEYRKTELIDNIIDDLIRLAKENNVSLEYYIAEFT